MAQRTWAVGIDFGGTNVKIGLLNASHRITRVQVLASRDVGQPRGFVAAVTRTIASLTHSVGLRPSQLRGVGIGVPGLVDTTRGIAHGLTNLPGWREVPLRRLLEHRLRCRCLIDNDANLYALGEWRCGAGRGTRDMVCLTLGTGVGGGLIFNGELYRGAADAAGEIGHMVVDPRGRRCACGSRGCLEAQVGTAAILSMARRAIRQGAGPLRTLTRQSRGSLTPELVSRAARAGDGGARQIWIEIGRWLGRGVANLVNLLNPERVILGGGVANAWGLFAPTLTQTVRTQAMSVSARSVKIARAQLGNSAGIVGAAVLVWSACGDQRRDAG